MTYKRNDECEVITRYLVGAPATPRLKLLYEQALKNISVKFLHDEEKLWESCLRNPWTLPHVDAWLGIRHRDHPIRKKIFVMVGLLETQPDYAHFFLPSRHSHFSLFRIGCTGVWAVIKIFTGRLITWIL